MRVTTIGLGVVLLVAAPGLARAEGAVAKGEDGRVGISYNYRGPGAAEERALSECGRRCRIVLHFRDTCAAVAVGRGGGGGWAARDGLRRAEEAALERCADEGNRGCRVEARGCDDR